MAVADVIIGANFGDEGKGLATDYCAAKAGGGAIVARFNGGAQAGHTVVTPDGKRHVFSHFGSGSFAGAETYLSRFFVCNPILFLKEHKLLKEKTAIPAVHVDARTPVTSPYDMMINQIAEESRGHGRHGSCGMGFGETLERNEKSIALVYGDLQDKAGLKDKLRAIRRDWVPQRLKALNIGGLNDKWRDRVSSDAVVDNFLRDIEAFLQETKAAPDHFLSTRRKVVFEGAQGLLLDQDRGWFPHVTRSHTGLRNALALAEEAGMDGLNVIYMTRAYATRHGAGPLPHELPKPPYARIKDDTNVTNDWQGTLRFGWLDADLLATSIANDLGDNRSRLKVRHGLGVTCLDQVDEAPTVARGGKPVAVSREALPDILKKAVKAEFLLTGGGPTRQTIA